MKPLKRHKALQPLSREHHHGLLLAWKIRIGFKKNIEPKRIYQYANWFYKTHLISHFKMEELYVFTILEEKNELIKQALNDHEVIRNLFENIDVDSKTLSDIAETLDNHIRFEERVLFPKIQEVATESQLLQIEKIHQSDAFEDNLSDEFWK
ncbi:hemerythrin domain-containing protein [Aestuariibaculum sp. M13]|uniref:hemerythrin domain-containing protein n=1 Tax=Aestuariibaculum sp. M13 TaxID=2967132 RepID=UPI00215A04E5|nr:hemerythrin domain-containing protein [Aestuariibaculum sp. M13]MCR8668672.1 hemerythrin domain-containing protein [Aestuariibaculum sp. M13]